MKWILGFCLLCLPLHAEKSFFIAKFFEIKIKIEKGMKEEALKALEEIPIPAGFDSPEEEFWRTTLLGMELSLKKNLSSLSKVKLLEKTMLRILEKLPKYGCGAVHRFLSQLYDAAPGWISIGSTSKSKEHLQKAVHTCPDYPGNILLKLHFIDFEPENKKEIEALLKRATEDPLVAIEPDFKQDPRLWAVLIEKYQKQLKEMK